jgi:hypothetical protein
VRFQVTFVNYFNFSTTAIYKKYCYIKRKKKLSSIFSKLSLKLITMQHSSIFSISTFVAIFEVLLSASHPTYGKPSGDDNNDLYNNED